MCTKMCFISKGFSLLSLLNILCLVKRSTFKFQARIITVFISFLHVLAKCQAWHRMAVHSPSPFPHSLHRYLSEFFVVKLLLINFWCMFMLKKIFCLVLVTLILPVKLCCKNFTISTLNDCAGFCFFLKVLGFVTFFGFSEKRFLWGLGKTSKSNVFSTFFILWLP